MVSTQKLVGTTVCGLFNLRLLLRENTTEEHADIIFKRTERAYDAYRRRSKVGPFTPTIRVVRDAAQLRLEVIAPYHTTPVGRVRLKTERVGDDTILTIANERIARKAAPAVQGKHLNGGFCLNELRRQLRQDPEISPQVKRLSADARAQLETFMDHCQLRNAISPDYTFDLDLTDEGVTLVAYVQRKRLAAISVFF